MTNYIVDLMLTSAFHIPVNVVALYIAFVFIIRNNITNVVHEGIIKTLKSVYNSKLVDKLLALLESADMQKQVSQYQQQQQPSQDVSSNTASTILFSNTTMDMSLNPIYIKSEQNYEYRMEDGDAKKAIDSKNRSVMTEFYVFIGIAAFVSISILVAVTGAVAGETGGFFDMSLLLNVLLTFAYLGSMVLCHYFILKYILDNIMLMNDADQRLVIFKEVRDVITERLDEAEQKN